MSEGMQVIGSRMIAWWPLLFLVLVQFTDSTKAQSKYSRLMIGPSPPSLVPLSHRPLSFPAVMCRFTWGDFLCWCYCCHIVLNVSLLKELLELWYVNICLLRLYNYMLRCNNLPQLRLCGFKKKKLILHDVLCLASNMWNVESCEISVMDVTKVSIITNQTTISMNKTNKTNSYLSLKSPWVGIFMCLDEGCIDTQQHSTKITHMCHDSNQ